MRTIVSSCVIVLFAVCLSAADPPQPTPGTTAVAPQPQPVKAPPTTETQSGGTQTPTNPPGPPALTVTKVISESAPEGAKPTAEDEKKAQAEAKKAALPEAGLGDSITLETADLEAFLKYAEDQKKAVTLYLDGKDTKIEPEAIFRESNRLRFYLDRNTDNKAVWEPLLRNPFNYPKRTVQASVGMASIVGAMPVKSSAPFVLKVIAAEWYDWLWLILLILFLVAFGYLAWKKDILRDGKRPAPYSLGRVQMAWWFFLILIGYVVIWLISGDQDTITTSLLGLMGISAGTALGAVLIESSKGGAAALSNAATQSMALAAALTDAQQKLTDARTLATATPGDVALQQAVVDAQAKVTVIESQLDTAKAMLNQTATPPKSVNWVLDILSESDGTIALHRFQIVVWTLVLGIMFLVSVFYDLTMPEFSATLLAAMGVSAGTYLGFKFPEK
jgi:hypothetical protein